jgi:hypothetical protein
MDFLVTDAADGMTVKQVVGKTMTNNNQPTTTKKVPLLAPVWFANKNRPQQQTMPFASACAPTALCLVLGTSQTRGRPPPHLRLVV